MSGEVGAARRRARRRAQVRRTALVLALLGLLALAFAIWFAVDAPDTTTLGRSQPDRGQLSAAT